MSDAPMPTPIHILLADDHPVVRDGLAAILSTQADFVVVGQASTGAEAVELAARLTPDVILLDLEMPEMDGVEALRHIRTFRPGARIIVFTAFDSDERIVSAVQAGAKGYLLKGAPRDELFKAIRVVNEGGSLLQPMVASKLLDHISHQHQFDSLPVEALTERETEVLKQMALGRSNKEVAGALVISERTVKFHVSAILGKLGAGNRTEAVTIAVQRGLVKL
jgi:NarL family two-component system response regulator LiaR